MSAPSVAIIILNWKGLDDTLACVRSLERVDYARFETVVIDNGSGDGSAAALKKACPGLRVLETGDNLGFAGGNNLGLEWALARRYDYALLLNNDTEVALDFLRRLVEAMERDPALSVVGPTIYFHADPRRIWSSGGHIDWRTGRTLMEGLGQVDEGQFGEGPREVDFVTGCAMLVRMDVVHRIGSIDPRFFAYYEETEWCVRMRRAGFGVAHVPGARVWHKVSPMEQAHSPLVHYYMTRNRLLFLRSVRAGWRAWAATLFLEYPRTMLSWSLRPRWRAMRPQRRVMLRAVADYFLGRTGRSLWAERQIEGMQ